MGTIYRPRLKRAVVLLAWWFLMMEGGGRTLGPVGPFKHAADCEKVRTWVDQQKMGGGELKLWRVSPCWEG